MRAGLIDQDEVGRGARDQQVDARPDDGARCRLVSVICWPTIGAKVVSKARTNCSRSRALLVVEGEDARAQEVEDRRHAAVVQEAEAADLLALVLRVVGQDVGEARVRRAEHADLLVGVLELRNLELLRLVVEGRLPERAEVALARVERVAAAAVRGGVGDRAPVAEERAARAPARR